MQYKPPLIDDTLKQTGSGLAYSNRPQSLLYLFKRLMPVFILSLSALCIAFFGLLGLPRPLWAAGPLYVAVTGVDSSTCGFISAPCRSIQQAISNAVNGDEIRVAGGTYTTSDPNQVVNLNKNLTLRGGYTSTNWFASPDPNLNRTTIDAQGVAGRRVMYVADSVVTSVSGFHLTGGRATSDFGGGVYNLGTLTLADCQIYGNQIVGGGGGGVANGSTSDAATLTLIGSKIYSNTTTFEGGGLSAGLGSVSVEVTEIYSNYAGTNAGGVIVNSGSNVAFKSSLIYSNTTAFLGGGVLVNGGTATFENDTLYDNYAGESGGGIYVFSAIVGITNSLIVANTAPLGGSGIFSQAVGSGLNMAHTDFFGNSANRHLEDTTGLLDPTTIGVNNRVTNPSLTADLHLAPGSPAIDSGTTTGATIDIDGEGRPFGSAIDRGADEYTLVSSCYARILQTGQVYTNVQVAVDAASPGQTVQVAGRCESATGQAQTLLLNKNLTVRGGYTVTDWVNARYTTILDARSQGRVISVTGVAMVTIDSLYLTGGSATDGAGVYLDSTGQATLQNNIIYGNTATNQGGGVFNSGRGNAVLRHNTFYNNRANAPAGGGGVYADSAGGSGTVTLQNNIIADTPAGYGIASSADRFLMNYNDFFSNTPDHKSSPSPFGSNDLQNVNPSFVDTTATPPNLRLQSNSLLINAADPNSSLNYDFEDQPRPQGTRRDIGADESVTFPGVDISDAPGKVITGTVSPGQVFTFTHTLTNTGQTANLTDTFILTLTNNNGWPVSLVGVGSSVGLASGATITFDVVVTAPVSVVNPVNNRTTITATSQTNSGVFDFTVDTIANPGLQLTPDYTLNADPGEVFTLTHILTNTGAGTDIITITFNSPFGWGQFVTPTSVTLGPGASQTILVRTQVVTSAAAGTVDVLTVRATSSFGFSVVVTDTVTANAITGDRYVRPGGNNINNNCTDPLVPCATISYAINQAAFDDTVLVAQGTYNEPSGIFINQRVNLRGGFNSDFTGQSTDPTLTIIDAQNSERGLRIQTPAALSPRVEYFTIQNGFSSGIGGGVYLQGSSAPALVGLNILNSTASRGGGLYIDTGTPILQNITISGTTASDRGGGIYINNSSNLLLEGLAISGTTATRGGGLYLANGSVVLTGSTVTSASATSIGGGIYQQAGSLTVQKTSISTNTAVTQGGGIYQTGGSLVISQTRLSGNSAGSGGGLYATGSISSTIWNSFIFSNTASTGSGGGLSKTSGGLSLVNDTFYGNQAAASGGGIFVSNSTLGLSNTIVTTNTATTSGGGLFSSGGSSTLAYNNFFGNSAASAADSNIGTGSNSLAADPRFINPAAGDLHLSLASPSIDTAAPTTFLRSDIDNDLRPSNQGFDMGADEVGGCLIKNTTTGLIYSVLQEAINAASSNDTLQISGICRGVQPRLVGSQTISQSAFISGNLTLVGGYDSNFTFIDDPATTLDALGAGRVAVITNSAVVTISRLNLINGTAAGLGNAGGGVYNANGAVTVVGSVITGNQATYGGGLYNLTGTLVLNSLNQTRRTQILSNTATYGGGLYLAGGTASLSHTAIYSNTANEGGGVYNAAVLQTTEAVTLAFNTATTGGGFYNTPAGQMSLERTLVMSNTADNGGGGFSAASGVLTLTNTMAAFNTASGDGGGLYNLSNNLTIRHNTFYANGAGSQGGGIYHNAGNGLINSTIVISNTSGSGGQGVHNDGGLTFDYNDVFGNTNSGATGTGNITDNPSIVTDPASAGFLHIPAGSPVEDRGDPASPIIIDIDNDPRPSNLGFDIGADEVGGCYVRINGNPPTFGNLQSAINLSNPGDEIRVAGICSGVRPAVDGGAAISQTAFLTKSLTLRGGYTNANNLAGPADPVANPTILDALNQGRVAYITNTATIAMDGIQLRQGQAVNGGGVFVGNGALTMTTSSVYSSTATNGGGLYLLGNTAVLSNVQVYTNTATFGGGIYNAGLGLTITGSTSISQNTATADGGGLYNLNDAARVITSEIAFNQARNGAGIYNDTGQMTLERNQIHDNRAINSGSGQGGGFYNNNSATTLDRGNRFFNNSSDGDGGAIYNNSGNLSIWNNFIYQNTTNDQGSGIYNANNSPNILHNTFYQNAAVNQGGAIYIAAGNPPIRNNIFDGNTGSGGSAIFSTGGGTLSFNDYSPTAAASQVSGVGAGSNNTNSNPPRFVNAASGDFHLQPSSPVIDQAETPGVVNHDFEDDPRPINAGSDIGADEVSDCLVWVSSTNQVYGQLQAAFDAAASGDQVRVAEGTCEGYFTIGTNINLSGTWIKDGFPNAGQYPLDPGPWIATTIRAPISATNRVMTVTSAVDSVSLSRIEISDGNTSGDGGGLYLSSGVDNANLDIVEIVGNQAGGNGGGLFVGSNVTATLSSVDVFFNTAAQDGGGIYVAPNGRVLGGDGSISDNVAGENGGGMYNDTGSIVEISGGVPVDDNEADNGGGVYINSSTFSLINKRINFNRAISGSGGGVYVAGSSDVTMINPGFFGNTAQNNGGAFYRNATGPAALYHATINQNEAQTGQGGGVYNAGSSMVISASIVAFNTAGSDGSGIHGAATVNVAYTMRETSNTYVGVSSVAGNIDGGDPFIRETGGDLLYLSPAIDGVPLSASSVDFDRFFDRRDVDQPPYYRICAKDMGRDEFLVNRILSWGNSTPLTAVLTPTASITYSFLLTNTSENWSAVNTPFPLNRGPGTGYTETITVTFNSSLNWSQIISITGGTNPTVISSTAAGVTLGPGQVMTVTVKVTVPPGTLADVADSTTLSFQAYQCPGGPFISGTSPAATTNVEPSLNFVIAPDNFGAALPGQTLTYTHIVTNLGNITDTYTIVPGPGLYASAQISQPTSTLITLGPGQTGTVVISVTINPEAAGGLPIPDTTSAIAISGADPAMQKAAANNTVISYTTGTRYVSLAGTDSIADETELTGFNYPDNNCTQPDIAACRTVQQALDQAAPGDLIKIDRGTYNVVGTDILTRSYLGQTLTQIAFVNKSVMLQGGFNRDNWDENPPNHISQTTILDPQSQGRGVFVTSAAITPTLDRLTIINGNADSGGAIYNENSDLTLNAVRLYDNQAVAGQGGGLYSGGGSLWLQNSLLHGNSAVLGGAVYAGAGVTTLLNDTFYNNSNPSESGGQGSAVYVDSGGSLRITNTIFATHTTTGSAAVDGSPADAQLNYNLYFGNSANTGGTVPVPDADDVLADPQFIDPLASPPELGLRAGSPARDAGDPATTLAIDYANNLRPQGLRIDIGAYERLVMRGLLFYPDTDNTVAAGSDLVITHTVENTGELTETVAISAASTQNWANFGQTLPYTFTLSPGLTRTVTVTYNVPFTAAGQTNVTVITAATSGLPVISATVTDRITVSTVAWQIGKVVTPTPTVRPGDRLTYTLTLTNVGDLDSQGSLTVTDELPAYLEDPVSVGQGGVQVGSTVRWITDTVVPANGGTLSFSYVATVTKPLTDGITIVNQTYTITGGAAVSAAIGSPVVVTVTAPAALTLTKSASPTLPQPGDILTYTLTVTNDAVLGLGPALNVIVTDTLPAEAVFQAMGFVSPTTGLTGVAGSTVQWQLANPLPPGQFAQVTVTVRLTSPLAASTRLTNTFGLTVANIPAVISGSLVTPITATNNIILAKTVEPTLTTPGDLVTYTITLSNTGNGIAAVRLTDTLAVGFAPTTYMTDVTVPGRSWDTTAGSTSVLFTATVPITPGVYSNTLITAAYDATQATLSNTAPITVELITATLSLSKTPDLQLARSGDTVTFTITVSNTGEVDLTGIVVGDPLAPDCNRSVGPLGVGTNNSYTCTLVVTADLTNTALAAGTPPFGPVVTATDTALVDVITPALQLRKTPANQVIRSGEAVTFTIAVTNAGDVPLTGVVVDDAIAPLCNQFIGPLATGAFTSYTCSLADVTADLTNTAIVTGVPPIGPVVTATDIARVDVVSPSLQISKTPDSQLVQNGGTAAFTITVTNSGDVDLTGVIASDPLASNCGRVIGSLATAAITTYSCSQANVTADFTNVITVSAMAGSLVVSASDSAVVDVFTPALRLSKTPDSQTVQIGQPVTFTITLTNNGEADLTGVVVDDVIAPLCNRTIGDLATGAFTSYTCSLANVTADFTNTATATGTPPIGPVVTALDTAVVTVITPAIQINKTPDSQLVLSNSPVTFTISVQNTGPVDLTGVVVDDAAAPLCNQTIGNLSTGAFTAYTCSLASVTVDFTNTATVSGITPAGPVITDTDDAFVDVIEPITTPSILISKTPDSQTIQGGETATFTLSVLNNGNVNLTNVTVTDALAPLCNNSLGTLAISTSIVYNCSRPNVTDSFTNTAIVAGTSPTGTIVTNLNTAFVDVTNPITTPAIALSKTPGSQTVRSGDTVTFTISVLNSGNTDLDNLTVDDPATPDCNRSLGSLATGAFTSYTCSRVNVTADFTNTANVSGDPTSGPVPVVTATASALVDVINPAVQISKTPDIQFARSGAVVTFTITVTNSGDSVLGPITTTDALAPDCDRTTDLLLQDFTWSYPCIQTVTTDLTNTIVITGVPPVGPIVTQSDSAFVDVISPAIQISKTPTSQLVHNGDTVTFTITVTNTGDIALNGVTVTDAQVSGCDRVIGSLVAGVPNSYTCTQVNVMADFTNTAVVTGTPPDGLNVTDTATATVTVINPALAVGKTPDAQVVSPGDTVTFTITLTNTGDVTLNPITITDALAPDCNRVISLTVGDDDSYECSMVAGSADFTNTVVAAGLSPAGRVVAGSDTAFVDASPPLRPTLLTPPNDTFTNNPNVTFGWSPTVDTVTYTLNVSGSLYQVISPTTTQTLVLTEGVYSWTVQSVDVYSRTQGYTDTWRVTVDTTPPVSPTLIAPPNGATTSGQPGFDWSDVTDNLSGPVTYTISISNNTFTSPTSAFTPSASLPPGVYTWSVRAHDRAGNTGPSSTVFTFEVKLSGIYLPIILKNFTPPPPLPPRPDLIMTNIELLPVSGRTYQVRLTARNQSATPVTFGNNFYVNLYYSTDLVNPIVVCGVQGSDFGAGQTFVIPFSYCQNNALYTFSASGNFTLRAVADAQNNVVESDETNNTRDTNVSITGLEAEAAPPDNPPLPAGPWPTPTSVP